MQPGDLIQLRKINSTGRTLGKPRVVGILLESPKFPTWGNYPKNYTILTPHGVKTFSDKSGQVFQRVEAE